MRSPFYIAKYSIISVLFLALFVLNLYVWLNPTFGALMLVFFVLYFGRVFGDTIAPREPKVAKTVFGAAGLLAVISLYGSVAYYVDLLNQTTVAIGIILIPLLVWFIKGRTMEADAVSERTHVLKGGVPAAGTIAIVMFLATFTMLVQNQIVDPVRSPWLVIPAAFFFGLFLVALLIGALSLRGKERAISLPLIVLFFFSIVSVALIAYPLGYGFDSFIHQATESHIFEHGTITPKPFYYIGQYALVLFAAHGFFVPIVLADKLLVPLLASILLPLAAYFGFVHLTGKRSALFGSLSLFFVPLSSFIATTPQGLANMWTLLVIFASLPALMGKTKHLPYGTLLLFGAAALATHPLAGIPVALYIALVGVGPLMQGRGMKAASTWATALIALFGSVALPAVFFVNAAISGLPITFQLSALKNLAIFDVLNISLFIENRFQPFLDAAYLWGWNQVLIIIALVVGAFFLIKRHKLPNHLKLPALAALMMFINYLILSTVVEFDFLIDYERGNYADRMFTLTLFFLIPLIGLSLARIWHLVQKRPLALKAGVAVVVAIILTGTVYLTYPRHDNYEISRGFNIGQSDYTTVEYIHNREETVDYVVLANQAVSAAAVDTYGFLQYFENDLFYYPIPTGGPMYDIYLDMVNIGPTHARALDAMNLADVDKAYFVVNDYWFLADKLIENAKRTAGEWASIENGATHIFIYAR